VGFFQAGNAFVVDFNRRFDFTKQGNGKVVELNNIGACYWSDRILSDKEMIKHIINNTNYDT